MTGHDMTGHDMTGQRRQESRRAKVWLLGKNCWDRTARTEQPGQEMTQDNRDVEGFQGLQSQFNIINCKYLCNQIK